jgi:hypothetical protein
MSRVINTANPGKERNQLRRTCAEVLRHLMFKRSLDDETKDMAAVLVFALEGIAETVEITTEAWEKRNYFVKADRFRLEWEWARPAAARLRELIVANRWERLPAELAQLAPRFGDVRILKWTREVDAWQGCYRQLVENG